MELVEIKKEEIFCDSSIVSRKFGQQHKEVVKRIEKLVIDLKQQDLRGVLNPPKTLKEDRVYRGREYKAYLMNKEFFSLLVPKFRGKRALAWQLKFNDAFYQMEQRLRIVETNVSDKHWIDTREQGKIARRSETDIIKEFVEYATDQGSTKAQFYYKHITNATYKALGLMAQSKPKLRDTMNIYEISQLMLAEQRAQVSIKKYMDLGRHYRDIYQSVKEDLINFANSLRIE
ncbi:Rha family transcriptional regulator [Candidatus Pacearchaeota archaeon]|nr:Rha family transcriptional regulator [Candidatus Pacearchaeota archaeon]